MKFLLAILFLCLISLGWALNEIYSSWMYVRQFDGLYFQENLSWQGARDKSKTYDPYGDWVCVNIRGMDYNTAVNVCKHEAGHEIWAEICEKDTDLCDRGQELLEVYSGK